LLHCAFQEIYEHGYTRASLDRILANSGVTKGALYHHFGSKAELAKAVIDEVIRPFMIERWADPIRESDDPITALREHATEVMANFTDQEMACGCPLNNLVQELANAGEGFHDHLARVCDEWRAGLAEAFERGKAAGTVREDVDPAAAAAFIVSSVEGLAATMKSSRDREVTGSATTMFLQLLESLRPALAEAPAA
jgi:AcrR family transcriptional regulator